MPANADGGAVVIAGGSGFLGLSLATHLANKGWSVVVLSRRPPRREGPWRHVSWDARHLGEWSRTLEARQALVNLVGRSCRTQPRSRCGRISRIKVQTRSRVSLSSEKSSQHEASNVGTLRPHGICHCRVGLHWCSGHSGRGSPPYRAELVFPLRHEHNHASGLVECANGDLIASWYRGHGDAAPTTWQSTERVCERVKPGGARIS